MTTTTASPTGNPTDSDPATRHDDLHAAGADLPRWSHGHVAWFNAEKGFGFLTPDTGPVVFVDHSVIDIPGFKTLTTGQSVVFTAADTGRGPEATRVVPYTRPPRTSWRAVTAADSAPVTGCAGLDTATARRDPARLPVAVWQRAVPLPCASHTWDSIAVPHPHR